MSLISGLLYLYVIWCIFETHFWLSYSFLGYSVNEMDRMEQLIGVTEQCTRWASSDSL